MSIWTIIPVEPLQSAKNPLAKILSPEERQHVGETILCHVMQVIKSVPQVTGTLVMSRDNHVLALARQFGAKTIQESRASRLNAALMRATAVVASWRSDAVLILSADLPFISPHDITTIIKMGVDYPSVVISPDHNRNSTNALFVRPPGLIDYAYGLGSYQEHITLAQDAGAIVQVYEPEHLSHDIGVREDIEHYRHVVRHGKHADTLTPALEGVYLTTGIA